MIAIEPTSRPMTSFNTVSRQLQTMPVSPASFPIDERTAGFCVSSQFFIKSLKRMFVIFSSLLRLSLRALHKKAREIVKRSRGRCVLSRCRVVVPARPHGPEGPSPAPCSIIGDYI